MKYFTIILCAMLITIGSCSKFHSKSYNSPKVSKIDVSVRQDLSEMDDFQEAELVDPLPQIKVYHVTFTCPL